LIKADILSRYSVDKSDTSLTAIEIGFLRRIVVIVGILSVHKLKMKPKEIT